MPKFDITEVLNKDILSGRSRFIKDGVLKFNGLRFEIKEVDRFIVHFLHKDMVLASMMMNSSFKVGDSLNFRLINGSLEIRMETK